jgi:hypothetical protein
MANETIVRFDAARHVYVVTDSDAPARFRVFATVVGNGSILGAGYYAEGESVTITAMPAEGWGIGSLRVDDIPVASPYTFIMPPHDVQAIAEFALVKVSVNITITSDIIQSAIDNSMENKAEIEIDGDIMVFNGNSFSFEAVVGSTYAYTVYINGVSAATDTFTVVGG